MAKRVDLSRKKIASMMGTPCASNHEASNSETGEVGHQVSRRSIRGLEPRWEGAGRFSGFGDVGRGIEAGFGRCGLEMDTEGIGGTRCLV